MPDGNATVVIGRHVVEVMGTVFSFDLRDPVATGVFDEAVALLHEIDETFSTYRPASVISRLRRGDFHEPRCPADVLEVLGLCEIAQELTDDFFTPFPGGELDPSGLVKGWAIQRVSRLLAEAGCRHHSVNGGGDVQVVGTVEGGQPWRIGVADPLHPGQVLAVADAVDSAVATSGTAERGRHIIDPVTCSPANFFLSVTITAPSILDADVIATAAFARGATAPDWIDTLDGVEGLFLRPNGHLIATAGFTSAPCDQRR